MRNLSPVFFFLLLLLLLLFSSSMAPSSFGKLIFILSGQSNMADHGGVSNDEWDQSHPSPSVLSIDAFLRWVEAAEPLHADIDVTKTCDIGPGLPFANAVVSAMQDKTILMGLVPCAISGTNIVEWTRGVKLYEDMVARTKAAVKGGGDRENNRIGATLWYQGESDTVVRSDAETYRGRMGRLTENMRTDLQEPELLVIQVALASGGGNFTEIRRQEQLQIRLHNVVTVDARGLPLQDDKLHLTTEAQVQLGNMLAAAYLHHGRIAHKL